MNGDPEVRHPTIGSCLGRIEKAGLRFDTVVDVGVFTGTPGLMRALPGAHHVLIEPSAHHESAIRQAYRDIPHTLHLVGVGDADAQAWRAETAIDGGEAITHTHILPTREAAEQMEHLRRVSEVPIRRLDSLLAENPPEGRFLVKIDVDGHEIPVLEGARDTLTRADAVVIEAPRMEIGRRTAWLEAAGFHLFDVVDLQYYRGVFWQADLVFLSEAALTAAPALAASPAEGLFDPAHYLAPGKGRKKWWKR